MSNEPIKQGDSIALSYGPKGITDITPWACTIRVSAEKGGAPAINQALTSASSDNRSRIGLISTVGLAPGTWHIMALLANSATTESKEIHDSITVETSGFVI
jgi:hypothetical protein